MTHYDPLPSGGQQPQVFLNGVGIEFYLLFIFRSGDTVGDKKVFGIFIIDFGQSLLMRDFTAFVHPVAPGENFFGAAIGIHGIFWVSHEEIQDDPVGFKIGFDESGEEP